MIVEEISFDNKKKTKHPIEVRFVMYTREKNGMKEKEKNDNDDE